MPEARIECDKREVDPALALRLKDSLPGAVALGMNDAISPGEPNYEPGIVGVRAYILGGDEFASDHEEPLSVKLAVGNSMVEEAAIQRFERMTGKKVPYAWERPQFVQVALESHKGSLLGLFTRGIQTRFEELLETEINGLIGCTSLTIGYMDQEYRTF